MYSKKEVVELTDDLLKHLKIDKDSFTGDRITSFLKEKGLIEPEIIEDESYSHTLTYGTSNTYPDNEITVNGITYTKKYRHC